MPLKQLAVLNKGQGKTSIAQAWANRMPFANYFTSAPRRLSCPKGLKGTFIIDELTSQSADVIQFVCCNIHRYDFYITCDATQLWKLPSDLKQVFCKDYPEFFI